MRIDVTNIGKPRRQLDWDAIGQDYRAGILSLREMACKHACSHSTIANYASRHGWVRCDPWDGAREGVRDSRKDARTESLLVRNVV